jgi:hypothetical protein
VYCDSPRFRKSFLCNFSQTQGLTLQIACSTLHSLGTVAAETDSQERRRQSFHCSTSQAHAAACRIVVAQVLHHVSIRAVTSWLERCCQCSVVIHEIHDSKREDRGALVCWISADTAAVSGDATSAPSQNASMLISSLYHREDNNRMLICDAAA